MNIIFWLYSVIYSSQINHIKINTFNMPCPPVLLNTGTYIQWLIFLIRIRANYNECHTISRIKYTPRGQCRCFHFLIFLQTVFLFYLDVCVISSSNIIIPLTLLPSQGDCQQNHFFASLQWCNPIIRKIRLSFKWSC